MNLKRKVLQLYNPANISRKARFLFLVSTFILIVFYKNSSNTIDKLLRKVKAHKTVKIDWHDYKFIADDALRTGPGEQGVSVEQDAAALNFTGYYTDLISVNRSLPDVRSAECVPKKYLANLPTVSVIIPFFNERFATIMRTAHSIFNRAPQQLIHEIIFVNDASEPEFFNATIDDYVAQNFLGRGRVIHLPDRVGLIQARMAGAREASGEVLLFTDAHTEATINYLPPLLEPIAEDYRTCTVPIIGTGMPSFKLRVGDTHSRSIFDWRFNVMYFTMPEKDITDRTEPYPVPLMKGCFFLISAKFFWELGGYDDQLEIWGGEQFELSFKIWMCGGRMYNVPCSHLGHFSFRKDRPFVNPRPYDYITRNYKRVFEVWLDEYKEYVYMRDPERWMGADVGTLLSQHHLRKQLKCKSFKWYLETVAPDILKLYPPLGYPWFAKGAIRSVGDPNICVDTLGVALGEIGIYPCQGNQTAPNANQRFELSFFKDIAHYDTRCLQVPTKARKAKIILNGCTHGQENQRWRYAPDTQMLVHGRQWCMECDLETKSLFVNPCNESNAMQKWDWGFKNETMLNNWQNAGAKYL